MVGVCLLLTCITRMSGHQVHPSNTLILHVTGICFRKVHVAIYKCTCVCKCLSLSIYFQSYNSFPPVSIYCAYCLFIYIQFSCCPLKALNWSIWIQLNCFIFYACNLWNSINLKNSIWSRVLNIINIVHYENFEKLCYSIKMIILNQ